MTNLKPCPFCGGEAALNIIVELEHWWVSCKNEKCESSSKSFGDQEPAIKAWNTRQEAKPLVWLPAGRNYTATRPGGGRYQVVEMFNGNFAARFVENGVETSLGALDTLPEAQAACQAHANKIKQEM